MWLKLPKKQESERHCWVTRNAFQLNPANFLKEKVFLVLFRNAPNALDQSFDFFRARVAGDAGAHQAVRFQSKFGDDRRSIKIAVRSENAALGKSFGDASCGCAFDRKGDGRRALSLMGLPVKPDAADFLQPFQ